MGHSLFPFQYFVVLAVLSDPEPIMIAVFNVAERPEILRDSNRPKRPDLFKLQGGMGLVVAPKPKLLSGGSFNASG